MVGPTSRDVAFESAGRRLSGHFVEAPGAVSTPGILFVHGLHSDQVGYRPRAVAASTRLSATCLTFDLGGHGRSAGKLIPEDLSAQDHLNDLLAAFDVLVAHDTVDADRIGVCGASYGGYLAVLLLTRRTVSRVVLRAPALHRDDEFDVPHGRRRPSPRATPNSSTALQALAGFRGDVLIVESGCDEVISHATIESYLQRAQHVRHKVIPGATHRLTDPAWQRAFTGHLIDWFRAL